jgi:hypothetical protein
MYVHTQAEFDLTTHSSYCEDDTTRPTYLHSCKGTLLDFVLS